MSHPSNKVTIENAGTLVRYHQPTPDQVKRHELLAAGAEAFLRCILSSAPDCADRSAAIRKVREAKMTASAAVALEPLDGEFPDEQPTGSGESTPIGRAVLAAARAAHEANRAYCTAIGDHSQVEWDDAPAWQKISAIKGVKGVIDGNGPKESHEGWLAEKRATAWKYGPVKDAEKKEHPCFVPYAELPPAQKAKDAIYVATVRAVLAARGFAVKAPAGDSEPTTAIPPVDHAAITTLYGTPVDELRAQHAAQPTGMHADYVVLAQEERAKGFVRPVRYTYKHVGIRGPQHPLRDLTDEEKERYASASYVKFEDHLDSSGRFWTQAQLDKVGKGCGSITTMGAQLSETYARSPSFYSATFCCACDRHLPVGPEGEFVWDGTNERVGT